MKAELKSKWLAGLRSGEYTQGRGQLVRNVGGEHRWCCLGVLADKAGLIIDPDGGLYDCMAKESQTPDTYVTESLGVDAKTQSELAHMNDRGRDFAEIADWIEENIDVE